MNIALLSNSLINRTLAFHPSYVLNEKIESIFLPAENHSSDELLCFYGRENIYICDNIDKAINKCDVIITSNKNNISRFSKFKRVVYIKNPWINKYEDEVRSDEFRRTSGKPVITILSLGKFTDQYYTEILVNKILADSGAKLFQLYSKETLSILSDLSDHDLLNRSLLDLKSDEADVVVVSIDGTKYHNDAEFVCELSRISPDMLFVCIDRTIDDFGSIDRIAGIVCHVSLIIQSPYISYDVGTGVKYPVYCGFVKVGGHHNMKRCIQRSQHSDG